MRSSWIRLLPQAGLLLLLACNSGTSPVAPSGTVFTISANPSKITPRGTSEIRVVALHPTGTPIRTGTEIRFTTNIGTIDEVVPTDGEGVARATLRGDGRTGKAEVVARSGVEGKDKTIKVTVDIARADLEAKFSAEISGLRVDFKDESTGEPTSWDWDFGDGKGSGERNPSYTYRESGTFLVTLTVSSPEGSDSVSDFVDVRSARARFSFSANGLEVDFTNESTPEPKTSEWDFGDNHFSTDKSPKHIYDEPGTYRVRLSITTDESGSDSTRQQVTVEELPPDPPEADFDDSNRNDLTIIFEDKSSNDPTSWKWDFGDGTTSTEQNPVHTFPAADTYLVTLTARNAGGEDSVSKFVTVP